MKKSISTRRVLETMLNQYNEYSEAIGYATAAGNFHTADKCQACLNTILDLMRDLGISPVEDYEVEKAYKTLGGVHFMYLKGKAVA